jgi:hypothetical protein
VTDPAVEDTQDIVTTISRAMHLWLKIKSANDRVPVSHLVRTALDEYRERNEAA